MKDSTYLLLGRHCLHTSNWASKSQQTNLLSTATIKKCNVLNKIFMSKISTTAQLLRTFTEKQVTITAQQFTAAKSQDLRAD